VSDKMCATCKYFQTSIRQPQGSGQKELVMTCRKGHVPIAWFSGRECEDYRPKLSETQEQKCKLAELQEMS